MNLDLFQSINAVRGNRWHQGDLSQWSLLEWAGAMCGEAGEAANAAKKLRRLDLSLPNKEAGLTRDDAAPLEEKLADECADTIIYALLILSTMGARASTVIARVFDRKSAEYGFPERAPLIEELEQIKARRVMLATLAEVERFLLRAKPSDAEGYDLVDPGTTADLARKCRAAIDSAGAVTI